MEVELFVHGVPKGEDFWGNNEDQAYFANFYSGNKDDEVRFIVETRKFNNRNYCYYTYLKNKNVVDAEDRPGSYFGISLRFEVCCVDIVNIYRLFDIVYNKYVIGNLLSSDSPKTRFLVSRFSEKKNEIQNIESAFLQLIKLSFSGNSFIPIDDSFINKVSGVPECNIADCTKDNIANALKKYSKVAVSPNFPTSKEIAIKKSYDDQIKMLTGSTDEQVKAITISKDKDISKLSNELTVAHESINTLRSQIEEQIIINRRLETERREKEKEIKQYAVRKNISEIIEQIKEPILNLSNAIGPQVSQRDEHGNNENRKHSKKDVNSAVKLLPLINLAILIVILLMLMFNAKGGGDNSTNKEISQLKSQIESIQQEKQQIARLFSDYRNDVQQKTEAANVATIQTSNPQTTTQNPKIDFLKYSGGSLNMGEQYSVSIKNFEGSGEWKVDGFTVTDKLKNTTTVIPIRRGSVTISFYQGVNQIDTRKFSVE